MRIPHVENTFESFFGLFISSVIAFPDVKDGGKVVSWKDVDSEEYVVACCHSMV